MEGSPETFRSWSCATQSPTGTSNDGCSAFRRCRRDLIPPVGGGLSLRFYPVDHDRCYFCGDCHSAAASAYSVRPLAARVSTPLHWHEVPYCEPADFTVLTIPKRYAEFGADQAAVPRPERTSGHSGARTERQAKRIVRGFVREGKLPLTVENDQFT